MFNKGKSDVLKQTIFQKFYTNQVMLINLYWILISPLMLLEKHLTLL